MEDEDEKLEPKRAKPCRILALIFFKIPSTLAQLVFLFGKIARKIILCDFVFFTFFVAGANCFVSFLALLNLRRRKVN